MSTYRLETLFAPRSVAVIGASPRKTSTGRAVLENLRQAGFPGTIYLVDPRYDAIEGIRAVKSYDALPEVPDVVAIAVPPAAVPDAVAAAARKGTAVGIIITAGLGHGPGSLAARCNKNACAAGMRLVGPNCLGVLVPRAKLNAIHEPLRLLLQRLQVGDHVADLPGIELELRHRRMAGDDAFGERLLEVSTGYRSCSLRNGGATARGLGPTRSTE